MSTTPHLFQPFKLRGVTFPNRVFVSPMCQYSAQDGFANEWHRVHLGARAVGGAGAIIVEATAVTPEGRISPADLGLWSDAHMEALRPIVQFLKEHGTIPGIQLAHAGRKASTDAPWNNRGFLTPEQGGWQTVAPSPIPFLPTDPIPHGLSTQEIASLVAAFAQAAARAVNTGFELIEIHGAHGYLLHEFLSPLSNHRTDEYGGSFENRVRFLLEVVTAIRGVIPEGMPLFTRLSVTDWAEGGWDLPQSIALSRLLRDRGVDLIDCSSGALAPNVRIPVGPGYQVPFAEAIRAEAGIPTGAVGLITDPEQAEEIVSSGKADIVLLARAVLRNPNWPNEAAGVLGAQRRVPVQYQRAF